MSWYMWIGVAWLMNLFGKATYSWTCQSTRVVLVDIHILPNLRFNTFNFIRGSKYNLLIYSHVQIHYLETIPIVSKAIPNDKLLQIIFYLKPKQQKDMPSTVITILNPLRLPMCFALKISWCSKETASCYKGNAINLKQKNHDPIL